MKLKAAEHGLQICDDLIGFNSAESGKIETLRDIFLAEVRRHARLRAIQAKQKKIRDLRHINGKEET